MTSQVFIHKSGRKINVKVVPLLGEEMYEILGDLWTLEDLEKRGWKKQSAPKA